MLRPIELADDAVAARVVEIQRAAYQVEAELVGFDGIPPLHEEVTDVRTLDLSWMGCWDDSQLVGLIAWTTTSAACEIDRLAVHPDRSRCGHGRRLVAPLLHHSVVTVSTGTANTPACRLYELLGFIEIGRREIAPDVTITEFQRTG